MDEVYGYIERITYQNEENGYTVAKLKAPKLVELICIVGEMPTLQPGETVRCLGSWKTHLVHGRQFEVESVQSEAPATLEGIKKYLGSGLIKGIGPVFAEKIVEHFGMETLNVIDQSPHDLNQIAGVGKKRVELITACWAEQRSIRDVMIFLQSHGVSPAFAQKIYKVYGNKSIEILRDNPYRLARDIFGIGFKSADKIAGRLGVEKDSDGRIDAGVEFVLSELSGDGHVCYPVEEFYPIAQEMLEVDPARIQERIKALQEENRVHIASFPFEKEEREFIWLKPLFFAEAGIAKEVGRLLKEPCALRDVQLEKAVLWVQQQLKIELAANQSSAVQKSLSDKMHIITGGPGTGKSTITNAILRVTEKLTGRILLSAPTGRAAKRMTEITGKKAYTIHSLLEYDFRKGGFKKNRSNPLTCDLIIVDEASMIDTQLMNSLLKAIPDSARVIFVGDINQLPSVGPGNVLQDLIRSNRIAVTSLNKIFRQAKSSQIVTSSHAVNEGRVPDLENDPEGDFFFLEVNDPEEVHRTILDLVSSRLPMKYGFNPIDDIQVLAPMRKGVIGTDNLNATLQKSLNRNTFPLVRSGRSFLKGDKVMQVRNNYNKGVFNGDIGRIVMIDHEEQAMYVSIEGTEVEYDFSEIDELVPAYAISIHKSQGGEYPCVVIPVHTSHYILLTRNLIYTGMTRGKRLVVMVGSKRALYMAVHNNEVKLRYTGLLSALKGEIR